MIGRPKVGEYWVCRRGGKDSNVDPLWLYKIVATSRDSIVGVKSNFNGELCGATFDRDGTLVGAEEYVLTRKSRTKRGYWKLREWQENGLEVEG